MFNATRRVLWAGLWLGALVFEAGGFGQNYISIIVVPHVPGSPAHQTFPYSINEQGVIAGYYTFGSGLTPHGFVRATDGTITPFDPPGVPVSGTFAFSINAAGAITGYYVGGTFPFTNHGFVRSPEGNFVFFDPPGSTSTTAVSINGGGAITGYYFDASNVKHGFVRSADGTLTSFDPPGSTATTAVSVNASGAIAGYDEVKDITHGFVRQPNGTFVTFDPPESTGTTVQGINNAGVITGYYTVASGQKIGFVRAADGTITSFQAGFSTFPTSINAAGAVTGSYVDSSGTSGQNFVRAPDGSITSFVPLPTPVLGFFCGGSAFPTSINNNGAIVGWCFTGVPNPSIIGFARFQ
ncbi:MAG: hypothetical protein JO062_01925 [Bryobacterales bacterium]|nr:hypothetical protein [Bryobacterales bacterium]